MDDLQKRIDYLIDIEKNINFALQDKNLHTKLQKSNCVFYPMEGQKYVQNAEVIRKELVAYLATREPQKYILHYSRELIFRNTETLPIDNRSNDLQTKNIDTLQDMDDRNKDEKRSDDLQIRKMGEELGELRAEVKNLNKEIKKLEQEKQELEEQLDQEIAGNSHAQMADATTSTIGQVAQLIPTLLDKYFAIQEQKNALLAEQIRRQAPPRPQQPQNQTFEQPANGFYYEGENWSPYSFWHCG